MKRPIISTNDCGWGEDVGIEKLFIFLNGIPGLGPRAGVIFLRPLSGDLNKESLLTLYYKRASLLKKS
jgi:hypothetical protein